MAKLARNRRRRNEARHTVPELTDGQTVARVLAAKGENIYEVDRADGTPALYTLPKRLRYVTFIKRGSYVFVRDDHTRGPGKLRGDIETVVLPTFLPHVRKQPFWPARFLVDELSSSSSARSDPQYQQEQKLQQPPAGPRDGGGGDSGDGDGGNDDGRAASTSASASAQPGEDVAPANGNRKEAEVNGEDDEESSDDEWQIGAGNPNRSKWAHFTDDESSDEE